MKLSVALVSWRRQYHLPVIVENLRRFPEIDDITVFQNEFEPIAEVAALDATVSHSSINEGVFGRFLAARNAAHSAVLLQDDDLTVNNVHALIAEFESHGGTKIVANLADDGFSRHWQKWQNPNPPLFVELGFGSIIPRDVAFDLDQWPYDHELLQRKADKIATVMNPWAVLRAGPADITRLFRDGKESGRDENSLWLRNDHHQLTAKAVRYAQSWKAMRAGISQGNVLCRSCSSSSSASSVSKP